MAEEDQTEDTEEGGEEKPKGSKKLLLIGLLVGLLLGGGGGAGAFFFLGGSEEEAVLEEEELPEEVVVEEPTIDSQYVKIEQFTVPNIHNNRVIGHTVLHLSLEVDGVENKLLVVRSLPIIRDKMLRFISKTPVNMADNPYKINFPLLKKKFQEFTLEVTHKDVILRVLVVEARRM